MRVPVILSQGVSEDGCKAGISTANVKALAEAEGQQSKQHWDTDHIVCLELEPAAASPLPSKLLLCLAMGPQ